MLGEILRRVFRRHPGAAVDVQQLAQRARLEAQGGAPQRARALLERAARLAPSSADIRADLGNVHAMLGDYAAAARSYAEALALDPGHPAAHNNLGMLLARDGEREAALGHFRSAIAAHPEFAPAIRNLVAWLPDSEVPTADIALLARVAASSPGHGDAHAGLGALHLKGAFNAAPALAALDRAVALGADDADPHAWRGVALHDLGRAKEAVAAYDRALARDPQHVAARFHRALSLLALGRFAEGWPDYELRLRSEDRPQRALPGLRWQGEPLEGRTLLVHAEQGVGDEILFASCLPDAIREAGRCIVECDARLASLYRRSFPRATVTGGSQLDPLVIPPAIRVDCHAPIGSLPGRFRQRPEDFPAAPGYLRPDPQRVANWRARLAAGASGPRVGIAWRGGTLRSRGPARSIAPGALAPVLRTPGVDWVSLQRGAARGELDAIERAHGVRLAAFPETLEDLDETAALLAALDLTVTIDSTVAQLAGALGSSLWVLLAVGCEWRYGARGERMPWFPAARLFRQSVPGDWVPVVSDVARELVAWTGTARRRRGPAP